jgi:hypothetical protein
LLTMYKNDNFSIWNTKACPLLTVCMVNIIETSRVIRTLIPSWCWCWCRVIAHLCFGFIYFSQTEIYKNSSIEFYRYIRTSYITHYYSVLYFLTKA